MSVCSSSCSKDDYDIGTFEYDDTALGTAMEVDAGFAKVIVGEEGDVLWFHIVGPHVSLLIHRQYKAGATGLDPVEEVDSR